MTSYVIDLVRSGRIADIALCVIAVEAILLGLAAVTTGKFGRLESLANLAAGACLLLALKVALNGGDPFTLLGWLGAALIANLVDLPRRWRG